MNAFEDTTIEMIAAKEKIDLIMLSFQIPWFLRMTRTTFMAHWFITHHYFASNFCLFVAIGAGHIFVFPVEFECRIPVMDKFVRAPVLRRMAAFTARKLPVYFGIYFLLKKLTGVIVPMARLALLRHPNQL